MFQNNSGRTQTNESRKSNVDLSPRLVKLLLSARIKIEELAKF